MENKHETSFAKKKMCSRLSAFCLIYVSSVAIKIERVLEEYSFFLFFSLFFSCFLMVYGYYLLDLFNIYPESSKVFTVGKFMSKLVKKSYDWRSNK